MKTIITNLSFATQIPLLLGTQTLFNIGFYAVVPFIAIVLARDFGLAAFAVGLILGVRTFAQQGMFIAGGLLSDRLGARTAILTGIAVRVVGFGLLGVALMPDAPRLGAFIVGTVLTGLGGALFSPGLNVLVAAAEERRSRDRITLFAWLTITGEIGAIVGPLIGTALLGFGFAAVAAAGAGYFAVIGAVLFALLPSGPGRGGSTRRSEARAAAASAETVPAASFETEEPGRPVSGTALRDPRFAAFAALHSVDLLAYNQLYLAVPLVLAQTSAPTRTVAIVFAWVSILTLIAQLPLARLSTRLGPPLALRIGYSLDAVGFALIGIAATLPETRLISAVLVAATCFGLGHLVANPTALRLVPSLAKPDAHGSYFGLLATFGGCAVLLGNFGAGLASDAVSSDLQWLPWMLLGIAPLISALAVRRVLAARTRS